MAAGDHNSIQKLQAGLKLLGYDVGKVDGTAGRNTNDQIARFLKDNNITGLDARNTDRVLEKIQQKVLSDPGANERLMKMAQNSVALDSENLKLLQGGLALHNVRTGPGVDRIVIDGKTGAQTTEAAAKFAASAPLNSTQVKMLQGGLALLGYEETGGIDGKIGKNTQAAMTKFAAEHNLKPGEDILKAVQDAVKNSGDARERMHAIGNSQNPAVHNVMALQAGLSLMGRTTLIDGSKGPETKENFAQWRGANPASITAQFNTTGRDVAAQRPEPTFAPPVAANPTIKDDLSLRVRQAIVLETMPKAASAAGVPEKFMQGLWGKESTFGEKLVSESGCLGDWQFTKKTFSGTIEKHGAAIAQQMDVDGYAEKAGVVRKAAFERGSFSPASDFQSLRNDPLISTYAAAYVIKDKAREAGIKNINDPKEWGKLYAGFNVGPSRAAAMDGSLRNTPDVKDIIGRDAALNGSFFGNHATGGEALNNYARAVEKNIRAFEKAFPVEARTTGTAPVSLARSGLDEAGKPFTSMAAFREAAAQTVSYDDGNPRLAGFRNAGRELTGRTAPQTLALGPQPTLTI